MDIFLCLTAQNLVRIYGRFAVNWYICGNIQKMQIYGTLEDKLCNLSLSGYNHRFGTHAWDKQHEDNPDEEVRYNHRPEQDYTYPGTCNSEVQLFGFIGFKDNFKILNIGVPLTDKYFLLKYNGYLKVELISAG